MSSFDDLLEVRSRLGAGFLPLMDPDRLGKQDAVRTAVLFEENGADALLIGGSFLLSIEADRMVREIKRAVAIPVIIFPGDINQISAAADAILFLSMVSGRNPELLIGQHVKAAPILKAHGLEAISTGYILVESGRQTTTEFISNTRPLPRGKPDIAMAHALAAEYLGMQCVYLDAGSGAQMMVPEEMVAAVADYCSLPIIVGGGIQRPEDAGERVAAGASFIVVGSILESRGESSLVRAFADAVHHGA
ncbi:MAG: geranylgeranylglyceryl/heptaprenylglyceryl phosphate synthase [Candidatus Latescibacteria bacterium]|jgi:putative glycerol-1-phosphate prenyltransferase|nr:geranylgeranylglyceryl/heptaprenylglyceryl phosphate synthase [Candidatus Latescibacterota bacterium]